jgi:hypothetical protein
LALSDFVIGGSRWSAVSLGYCWQIREQGEMALEMSDKFMAFEN